MSTAWPSLVLALCAATSLVIGSALPILRTRFFEHRLSLLIGFSAGLMLATALHELIPEALEQQHQAGVWGIGAGFLVLYVAERLTHFHACRHRQCEAEDDTPHVPGSTLVAGDIVPPTSCGEDLDEEFHHHASNGHVTSGHTVATASSVALQAPRVRPAAVSSHGAHVHHAHTDSMALVGMSLHNFSDGLTTAAAFAVSSKVGLVVVLAIMIHQTAAGLSLGAIMLRAGRHRRRVLLSTTAVASFIVWGAVAYHLLAIGDSMKGVILGIAGGSFLYVAACDLLPEAHAADEGWSITAMTLVGYGFALLFM